MALKSPSKAAKHVYVAVGTISLALGIIGIPLPLLPTTPFLLLSAACYMRGSDKMYNWLITHKVFGQYIRDYHEQRGVRLKIKVFAISSLWATILLAIFFLIDFFPAKIMMILVASIVTIYILRLKTL